MRVSNDERQEVVNALIAHWSDGRLDEPTFDQRAARARSATTRSDLDALLIDLPPLHPAPVPSGGGDRRPHRLTPVMVALIVAVALMASVRSVSEGLNPHIPWLLVVVVVWWLARRRHRSGHHR